MTQPWSGWMHSLILTTSYWTYCWILSTGTSGSGPDQTAPWLGSTLFAFLAVPFGPIPHGSYLSHNMIKPTKCATNEGFSVRMKKPWALSDPLSAQWRLWPDRADAQADLSLRWAHTHFDVLSCRGSFQNNKHSTVMILWFCYYPRGAFWSESTLFAMPSTPFACNTQW